jgi:predicted dehydrogenase
MNSLGINPAEHTDNVSILLKYENGSNAVINYFANGSKAYSKERIEVFSQERTLILDNWKKLTAYGFKGFTKMKSRQDKGHNAQFALLNERVQHGGAALIPFESIVNTTRASFACIESMKTKAWVAIIDGPSP